MRFPVPARFLLAALLMLALPITRTIAQIPRTLSYQAVLTDKSGTPKPDGAYDVTFRLYDVDKGGVELWTETQTLDVSRGLFSAVLGSVTPFGDDLTFTQPYWLSLEVAPDPELASRLPLTATGYSLGPWTTSTPVSSKGASDTGPGNNIYYNNGNVGIGLNSPATRLTVSAVGYGIEHTDGTRRLSTYLSATGGWFGTRTADPLNFFVNDGAARMTVDIGGRVGIGTTTPASRLTVRTTGSFDAYGIEHTNGTVRLSTFLDGSGGWLGTRTAHPLNFYVNDGLPSLAVDVTGNIVITPNGGLGGYGSTIFGAPGGESGMSIRGGNRADVRFDGSTVKLVAGPGTGPPGSTSGVAVSTAGNVGIGTTTPTAKLEVIGRTKTGSLEITAGSDLAEPFDTESNDVIEPGSVMIIDAANPGKLKLSERPYDTRVAGIVSGAGGINPGITLQQDGVLEGKSLVAIAGRVYCKADAQGGPIAPGDLLTTSNIPGHAMRATERDRSHGAIIGKAMTGLSEGTGLVLVLVNLQ